MKPPAVPLERFLAISSLSSPPPPFSAFPLSRFSSDTPRSPACGMVVGGYSPGYVQGRTCGR